MTPHDQITAEIARLRRREAEGYEAIARCRDGTAQGAHQQVLATRAMNADLAAAAPRLLDALEAAVEQIGKDHTHWQLDHGVLGPIAAALTGAGAGQDAAQAAGGA